jgi:hypothetical protein
MSCKLAISLQTQRPGDLGVINLRIQNNALLMKNLHKLYNHYDIPWVNLIRKSYYERSVPHAIRLKIILMV